MAQLRRPGWPRYRVLAFRRQSTRLTDWLHRRRRFSFRRRRHRRSPIVMRIGTASVQGFIRLNAHEAGLPTRIHADFIRTVGSAATRGEVLFRIGLLHPKRGVQVEGMPHQCIAGLFHRVELHSDMPGVGRSCGHTDGWTGSRVQVI